MSNKYLEKIAKETFKDRAKHTLKYSVGSGILSTIGHGLHRSITKRPATIGDRVFKVNRPGEFVEGAGRHVVSGRIGKSLLAGAALASLIPAKNKDVS